MTRAGSSTTALCAQTCPTIALRILSFAPSRTEVLPVACCQGTLQSGIKFATPRRHLCHSYVSSCPYWADFMWCLPSSGWFRVSIRVPLWGLLLLEEGRYHTFSSTARLLCFCLNSLQSLKHDTFQNVSPALSILLPPTSVPFPLAYEMYYS